jgi:hypothetical protein
METTMNKNFIQKIQKLLEEDNKNKSSLESLLTFLTKLINIYKKLERTSADLNLINDNHHTKETKLIALKLLEEFNLIKINNTKIEENNISVNISWENLTPINLQEPIE